jgi:hypothetical protein
VSYDRKDCAIEDCGIHDAEIITLQASTYLCTDASVLLVTETFIRKRIWISHSTKRCYLHATQAHLIENLTFYLYRINQASLYLMIWSTIKMGRKMRSVLLRNRKSGYTTTITPYKEDSEYWYVIETKDGDISETRRYSKSAFDLMEEK